LKNSSATLAVDGEIEQREFPGSMILLQSNPDGKRLAKSSCSTELR
jgi:hypothetical protein